MKFLFVSFAALAALSTAPSVTSLRVVSTPGHADVVIGVESSTEVQDFLLDAPHRVVVDLKGVTLTGSVPTYDRIDRGGITDVRVSQLRSNTVRVVIQLDSVHAYAIERGAHEVRIAINSGDTKFATWAPKFGDGSAPDNGQTTADNATDNSSADEASADSVGMVADATTTPHAHGLAFSTASQPSRQPRITVTYQDADIHDVIAAFATFSGRTIVVGRDVTERSRRKSATNHGTSPCERSSRGRGSRHRKIQRRASSQSTATPISWRGRRSSHS